MLSPNKFFWCCSKALEKITFDKIFELICDQFQASHYGSRKNCSATLQLPLFPDEVFELYDDDTGDELTVPLLQFAQVFDTVPYEFLLKKIQLLA